MDLCVYCNCNDALAVFHQMEGLTNTQWIFVVLQLEHPQPAP